MTRTVAASEDSLSFLVERGISEYMSVPM